MYDAIVLSGITEAGKSYLIHRAAKEFNWLNQIPAVTTRERRDGVGDEETRIFLDDIAFEQERQEGKLLFVNEVFGKKYAYRATDIDASICAGKTALIDIKISAVSQVRARLKNIFCIYVVPGSSKSKMSAAISRNNWKERVKDAAIELQSAEKIALIKRETDIIFENSFDESAVSQFLRLIASLTP